MARARMPGRILSAGARPPHETDSHAQLRAAASSQRRAPISFSRPRATILAKVYKARVAPVSARLKAYRVFCRALVAPFDPAAARFRAAGDGRLCHNILFLSRIPCAALGISQFPAATFAIVYQVYGLNHAAVQHGLSDQISRLPRNPGTGASLAYTQDKRENFYFFVPRVRDTGEQAGRSSVNKAPRIAPSLAPGLMGAQISRNAVSLHERLRTPHIQSSGYWPESNVRP